MIYLILILSLMANALANVFIKAGMKDYKGGINISFISHMLKTPNVIIGLLFFALAFIGYSFVLSRLQLSIAYPIMTGAGFLVVSIFSLVLFNEPFNIFKVLGMVFIFVGIIFLAR
jgi:multidrug transporter EmrE-like cation transporter